MQPVTLDEVFQLATRADAAGQSDLAARLFVAAERLKERKPVSWKKGQRAYDAAERISKFCLTS